jgi:hypothetical protein
MAYDLDVEATVRSKKWIHERALTEDWLLLFGHDRRHATRLVRDERGEPVSGELIDV